MVGSYDAAAAFAAAMNVIFATAPATVSRRQLLDAAHDLVSLWRADGVSEADAVALLAKTSWLRLLAHRYAGMPGGDLTIGDMHTHPAITATRGSASYSVPIRTTDDGPDGDR